VPFIITPKEQSCQAAASEMAPFPIRQPTQCIFVIDPVLSSNVSSGLQVGTEPLACYLRAVRCGAPSR
jgi:hypothetical protein